MPNPPIIICDSDVLIQFFIAADVRPLRCLKERYGIQPAIVPEVESEVSWTRTYKDRHCPSLKKAISNGTLLVLDESSLRTQFPSSAPSGASGLHANIQARGALYERIVDYGEAYTHAAAVVLGVPSMSNDGNALRALRQAKYQVPSPVLRFFDLVVLAFQIKELSQKDCNNIRRTLIAAGEGLHHAFKSRSFEDGLPIFGQRILDGSLPAAAPNTADSNAYTQQLIVFPI